VLTGASQLNNVKSILVEVHSEENGIKVPCLLPGLRHRGYQASPLYRRLCKLKGAFLGESVKMKASSKPEPRGKGRILSRLLQYFNYSYSIFGPPLLLLTLASVIWTQVKAYYPFHLVRYDVFVLLVVFFGLPSLAFLGWFIATRTHLIMQNVTVATEDNPYAVWKITLKDIVAWKVYREMPLSMGKNDLVAAIDELLKRNGTS